MSGLGVVAWAPEELAAYAARLEAAGWTVEHCAHCDRSNRHPSCRIVPIEGRVQLAVPRWADKTEG